MAREVLEGLLLRPGGIYVDGTLGPGGHTEAALEQCPEIGLILGLDRDTEALEMAGSRLQRFGDRIRLVHGNFSLAGDILEAEGIPAVDGVLLDLGISSFQLERSGRGFSFSRDDPLDMRMDRSESVTAADMVNRLPADRLEEIFRTYGEERWAKRIAGAIQDTRRTRPILTSADLARIVSSVIPRRHHPRRIHPATKVFQALRIAVNRELENLKSALDSLPSCLRPGGRLCVISFHSLEDRLVKDTFRTDPRLLRVTRKPLVPQQDEIIENPRARSAKLRIAQRRNYNDKEPSHP